MDIILQIKSLLSQAELYRSQGLFTEAKEKYDDASEIINKIDRLKNKASLLKMISGKVEQIEQKTAKANVGPSSPELSEKGQNLIKNLFGENDLEKAVALAKFGQFERAIVELEVLLKDDVYRVEAGKNIMRCKIAIGSVDDAIDQYNKWLSGDLFTPSQLDSIRTYLQPLIDRKGIDKTLPAPDVPLELEVEAESGKSGGIEFNMPEAEEEEEDVEILDITSIGITFTSGTQKGKMVEFDVNFQSGSMLSLIISKADQGVIEDLREGDKLEGVQFYSPIAMFKGTAVIANKTEINTGPKQGDFCLDVKVTST
jgi:tetratricopeptide (TPR) repeat protein